MKMAKTKSKTLIIPGCRIVLPPELGRELPVIEFALPGRDRLNAVLSGIMESANIRSMEAETREKVIDAACGFRTIIAVCHIWTVLCWLCIGVSIRLTVQLTSSETGAHPVPR